MSKALPIIDRWESVKNEIIEDSGKQNAAYHVSHGVY